MDSLRARSAEVEADLEEGLSRGLWGDERVRIVCTLFYHPQERGEFWAGAEGSLAFSLTPYIVSGGVVKIRWGELEADLLEACYSLLSSSLLVRGDLLLETTGNHAAIREDLLGRYGFGFVSLASRALGQQRHKRDPSLLRELIDRWATGTSLDPKQASRAVEFFRQTMRLGMAAWLAAPLRGIPDSAIYFYQLERWIPTLRRDAEDFHKAFRLVVAEERVRPSGPLKELTRSGVFERIGFYMARRIDFVLGRERLLRDFRTNEVEFFLDYIALQEEADLQLDKNVCLWVFDLANELDRLVRLASHQ